MTAVPLTVLVPLIAAAGLAGLRPLTGRRFADVVTVGASAATAVLCAIVLAKAGGDRLVYWFGDWQPRDGVALGISFSVDELGAALALLVAVLGTLALLYSVSFMREADHVFHVLMLVFIAGMVGFSLAGDLFTMFVFFELLGVPAYALAGYKIDKRSPLEGSLNFAVTNTVGSISLLFGIGLLYGRTGALNLAQLGEALGGHADGLVIVGFTLIATGFFVKAAIVPFHFWLADAHAVAPAPVCMMFTGAMAPLGVYGIARVYWAVFEGPFGPHEHELRAVLVVAGLVTALLGGVMCFAQRHLKRLVAFITVSHMGFFLVGVALLTHDGLAGTAVYIGADGCAKAALFACAGILQHRLASVDERSLHGRGRELRATGVLWLLGGLLIATAPPFGPFLGKALIEDGALKEGGYDWVPAIFVLVTALTGGAVIRTGLRVFLGWGPPAPHDEASEAAQEEGESESEAEETGDRTPPLMWLPAALLVLISAGLGFVPGLSHAAGEAGVRFIDTAGYAAAVLHDATRAAPALPPVHYPGLTSYLYGAGSLLGALTLAAASLLRERLPRPRMVDAPKAALAGLRQLHSGRPGDYIAWASVGMALFGGLFALTLG